MRIKAVTLAWFRGAADPVALEPKGRSMVVYGANGAGKSSFVDAIEYALNDGKIGHLAHEYSGKRQEKGVLNTHLPQGRNAELVIALADDAKLKIEIRRDGVHTRSGGASPELASWDYPRTVLRQTEVSAFIHGTKGEKYSALLPLLGLHSLEFAAENLRQLAKGVSETAKLKETRARLDEVGGKRKAIFGKDTKEQILAKIEAMCTSYGIPFDLEQAPGSTCRSLRAAIESRRDNATAEARKLHGLHRAGAIALGSRIAFIRSASLRLADSAEPLIEEALEVLRSADAYAAKLNEESETGCPACGQKIHASEFKAHVLGEKERLGGLVAAFDERRAAVGLLCSDLSALKSQLGDPALKTWRDHLDRATLGEALEHLDNLKPELLRESCSEADLAAVESRIIPLAEAARAAAEQAPPDVKQLTADFQAAEVGEAVFEAEKSADALARAEALKSFVERLEEGVREEIRVRAQASIEEISEDLRRMWAVLHPTAAIEDIRLYLPTEADKAIDIGLQFHGRQQDSPRLTLSEGYRNSLGLCIFLAMAKRDASADRPLVLDDVVVSLDRNHRGKVAQLLQQEFGVRQVLLLTHDREWFAELRRLLPDGSWAHQSLMPFDSPTRGIRWSHRTKDLDDARAQMESRPDSAGNDARKIMDAELAVVAEKLCIRLPYLRVEKNDHRGAHEFLERLIVDGSKCFKKRLGEDYVVNAEAIGFLKRADELLITWGNSASHTDSIVPSEASELIDACEAALASFKCSSCKRDVWFADAPKWRQCQCGAIRWLYG